MKKFRIGGIEVVRRVPRRRGSFLAKDLSTGRELVLKRFSLEDEEEKKRFRRLRKMLGRGERSSLFANCQFISEGDVGYVVREYVQGTSLDQLNKSKLRPKDIVDFGVQISRQLAIAHGSGIPHGNLKASNLVLTPEHKIKVVDFAVKGGQQDARSDLHSVGRVLSDMVDKRRRTPPDLKVVLDNLLQADPEARMQSADELHEVLQEVGAKLQAPSASATKPPSPVQTETPRLQRFVNTWLQTEGAEPLVREGEWYSFNMNIGMPRPGEAVNVVPFSEPDWGDNQSLHLLVALFSRDFVIKEHSLALELPRLADSPIVSTKVKPLHAGSCEIEIVISLAKELEVLQIVSAEVKVESATPVVIAV